MKIVLRADASQTIGAGHVMRSLPIIEEFIARNFECIFIGNVEDIDWLHEKVKSFGFSKVFSSEDDYCYVSEEDILIVDSYNLPVNHDFLQKAKWRGVISIVDAFTPAYKASLRIQIGVDEALFLEDETPTLSGSRFLPVREFGVKQHRFEDLFQIMVTGGGGNPNFYVENLCAELMKYEFDFRCKIFAPRILDINFDGRFELVKDSELYSNYSMNSDIVFCTASYSSLEFLANGLAVGVSCAVENQRTYYDSLNRKNLVAQISAFRSGKWSLNRKSLSRFMFSEDFRESLKKNATKEIDFSGATRIVDAILSLI